MKSCTPRLSAAGKLSVCCAREEERSPGSVPTEGCFDILSNLRLLPKFCEKDLETFFALFEQVADTMRWPESAVHINLDSAGGLLVIVCC